MHDACMLASSLTYSFATRGQGDYIIGYGNVSQLRIT